MPNINLIGTDGDVGNLFVTKEYLMSVYPQISNQLITPELWAWGNSAQNGATTFGQTRSTPVTTFAGGTNWKQIGAGGYSTGAIKTDGTLWMWGTNSFGNIGDNTTSTKFTPVTTFAGGTNWKQVSSSGAGGRTIGAIKTDGTLWTWGGGGFGQLGDNTASSLSQTPVTTFAGGTNWKQVASGGYHIAAIKTDGTLWLWGRNHVGQIGDNTISNIRLTPVTTFAGGTDWKQVSCGNNHTVAIKTDGTLWIWGTNFNFQLGTANSNNSQTPVTTFAGGTNWKQVSCGFEYTAAIKTDGTLWAWGAGGYGQLGNNSASNRATPLTTFAGGTNWRQVSCGGNVAAAIKTDGTLWTWGHNSTRQIGNNGTNSFYLTPVTTFAGGTSWIQIACGQFHVVAIKVSDDLQGI